MRRRPKLTPEEVVVAIGAQLVRLGDQVCTVGGTICFDVPGAGRWTVSLDTPGGRWSEATSGESADTTVTLPERQFADLVLNPAALAPTLDDGTVQVDGDVEKLAQLGGLLANLPTQDAQP